VVFFRNLVALESITQCTMIFNIPLSQSQYEVIHYLKGRYDKGEDFDYCNELDVIIKNIVLKNGSYLLNINTTESDLRLICCATWKCKSLILRIFQSAHKMLNCYELSKRLQIF